jgi:energy-dependent translational throttle protein EttA
MSTTRAMIAVQPNVIRPITRYPSLFPSYVASTPLLSSTVLFGKKSKRKGTSGTFNNKQQQQQQTKQSIQDQRLDAATRQFMFTLMGLTKVLPDKSKTILDNINLSFFPGAKVRT